MRNRLVHDYAGVLADVIWNVVQKNLDSIKKEISNYKEIMEQQI